MKFILLNILTMALIINNCDGSAKNPMRKWHHLERLKRLAGRERPTDQASTVQLMIERLIPGRSAEFVITVNSSLAENGRDVFIIDNNPDGTRIDISGNTGVAVAMGFQYYTKIYGGCLYSWSGNQVSSLPSPLPRTSGTIRIVSNDLFRYYQNVCTVSYSFVWWDWARWEQEIDWMALNGFNLPLAFSGQEEIFRRVYFNLGFTQADMDEFFTGPAFLAWGRMGNIDGWGGPLPESYYQGQLQLQHQILQRMRDFGMIPVLPAFSGHVPPSFSNYYPNANLTRLSDWGGFNDTYCCTYLLDPSDSLFQTIGAAFITEMQNEFGVDHVYNCDTFNEMTPPSNDTDYIRGVGQSVFSAMVSADPNAIWLMQGWLFVNQPSFWNPTVAEALLTSVPIGRMIVLDLASETSPQYQRLSSFFGQPWIWCMLHNFGGTKGLYGVADTINVGTFSGRSYPNSSMVGTGITMEGIEQNDIMYEFMNEMAYLRAAVDVQSWFSNWSKRRYGASDPAAESAWVTLSQTALNAHSNYHFHGEYVVISRPSFKLAYNLLYNISDFLPAWDSIVEASRGTSVSQSDLFHHDLVDISREALVYIATIFYSQMQAAGKNKSVSNFTDSSTKFLDVLTDLETLLASDRRFLLGVWLESAKALASVPSESTLYEYNARNQVTLWGPSGNIIDYASKQWSGLVADYYKPRWQLFVDQATAALTAGVGFNQTLFDNDVFNQVESPFTFNTNLYPTQPAGDPVAIAQQIYTKWRNAAHFIQLLDKQTISSRFNWHI